MGNRDAASNRCAPGRRGSELPRRGRRPSNRRKGKTMARTKVVVGLAALGVAAFLLFSPRAEGLVKAGEKAPEISATTWFNVKGTPTLASLSKGAKAVVVEFWATWCPPCRRSIPHLNALHKELKDKGIRIVGLSDEDPNNPKVKSFIESMIKAGGKMDYIVGFGSDTGRLYGVRGIPTAAIVVNGKIDWIGHPLDPRFEARLKEIAGK
ncbi:MAG: TlpA family protein disulfide reductase [Planctomycetota bacterium]|nr:MAG: TlpA family protein disulfide reductase [Planctomycetota bacterium]